MNKRLDNHKRVDSMSHASPSLVFRGGHGQAIKVESPKTPTKHFTAVTKRGKKSANKVVLTFSHNYFGTPGLNPLVF